MRYINLPRDIIRVGMVSTFFFLDNESREPLPLWYWFHFSAVTAGWQIDGNAHASNCHMEVSISVIYTCGYRTGWYITYIQPSGPLMFLLVIMYIYIYSISPKKVNVPFLYYARSTFHRQ